MATQTTDMSATGERVSFDLLPFNEAVEQALRLLRRDGVVVLDDLVDPALLSRCLAQIEDRHPDMARTDRAKNYGPYEGRHCLPMIVDGLLAQEAVLLPKAVATIAKQLLSAEYKVDSVGLLVSAPGAPDQVPHHDGWLFPDEGLDRLLPPFALAFSLPLVRMDERSGRTAFWKRSHRSAAPAPDKPYDFAPVLDLGSALLWDFRVMHCGLANMGETPRPIIFTVLSREWWVEIEPPEAVHYRKLRVSNDAWAFFSPKWRRRFSRARQDQA